MSGLLQALGSSNGGGGDASVTGAAVPTRPPLSLPPAPSPLLGVAPSSNGGGELELGVGLGVGLGVDLAAAPVCFEVPGGDEWAMG